MLAVAIELCRREQIEALLEYLAQSRERTSVPLRLAWAHAVRFYGDPSKVAGAFERALDVGAPNELCQPFISAPPRKKKRKQANKQKPKGKLAEQQQPRSDARDHEVSENAASEAPDSSDRNWMLLLLVALVAAVIHRLSC